MIIRVVQPNEAVGNVFAGFSAKTAITVLENSKMMLRFWRPLYRISENPRMIKHYYNENDPFAAHVLRERLAAEVLKALMETETIA